MFMMKLIIELTFIVSTGYITTCSIMPAQAPANKVIDNLELGRAS